MATIVGVQVVWFVAFLAVLWMLAAAVRLALASWRGRKVRP